MNGEIWLQFNLWISGYTAVKLVSESSLLPLCFSQHVFVEVLYVINYMLSHGFVGTPTYVSGASNLFTVALFYFSFSVPFYVAYQIISCVILIYIPIEHFFVNL